MTSAPAALGRAPFVPDAARAAVIDRNVRQALAESLANVFEASGGHLAWRPEDQHALLAALRSHAVAPAVFGCYAELVEALLGEDTGTAQARLDSLLRARLRDWAAPRVTTLDEASLGHGVPALYARFIDDDADMPVHIGAVGAAELARGEALHDATAMLLEAAAPGLLGEIETVAPEIVLVRDAGPGAAPGQFGGASTFYLWGAMILNSAQQQTRPQMAEAMAHEAAHATLLGSTLGEPMVSNDPAQRYQSPLRADARPMDGLVHASFVLARMMWCQDRLLQSGLLQTQEQSEATLARAANRDRFIASQGVIEAEARFTRDGALLWTAARDWVREAG
jgi:HEXXH motif-containing protein